MSNTNGLPATTSWPKNPSTVVLEERRHKCYHLVHLKEAMLSAFIGGHNQWGTIFES